MRKSFMRSGVVVLLAMGLILSGCSSGPVARVGAVKTTVMLASGADADPHKVGAKVEAKQGDVISTDKSGIAEVLFPDTSFLRLGPSSAATITELGSAQVQRTSIGLDVGKTWHNMQKLVADDAVYHVVTPVGIASARGTVFSVVCAAGPSCEFIVLDGEIEIGGVTLRPYQRMVLPRDSAPTIVPVDALPAWVVANLARDAKRAGAGALSNPPLEAAAIAGDWAVTFVTAQTNSTLESVGTSEPGRWTFGSPQCDSDCAVDVTSDNGWSASAALSAGVIRFSRSGTVHCLYDETGEEAPETVSWHYDYELTLRESTRGGRDASQLTGSMSYELTLDPPFDTCNLGAEDGGRTVRGVRDLTAVREP